MSICEKLNDRLTCGKNSYAAIWQLFQLTVKGLLRELLKQKSNFSPPKIIVAKEIHIVLCYLNKYIANILVGLYYETIRPTHPTLVLSENRKFSLLAQQKYFFVQTKHMKMP